MSETRTAIEPTADFTERVKAMSPITQTKLFRLIAAMWIYIYNLLKRYSTNDYFVFSVSKDLADLLDAFDLNRAGVKLNAVAETSRTLQKDFNFNEFETTILFDLITCKVRRKSRCNASGLIAAANIIVTEFEYNTHYIDDILKRIEIIDDIPVPAALILAMSLVYAESIADIVNTFNDASNRKALTDNQDLLGRLGVAVSRPIAPVAQRYLLTELAGAELFQEKLEAASHKTADPQQYQEGIEAAMIASLCD